MLKIKPTQLAALTIMWFFISSSIANASVTCAAGGTCTQTITMVPGWNAIHLQVTPDDISIDAVFADFVDNTGAQIDSVWTWLPHRAKIEFVQNQSTEDLLSQPGWLRYFHPSNSEDFLNNLNAVTANRAYLVKLEGTVGATLVVTGTPVIPRTQWVPDALNLVGFHVDPAAPPTFTQYFAASSAHTNPIVYQLNSATGVWDLKDPVTTIIDPDLAYWVYSDGGSSYTGPLQLEQGGSLEFASRLNSLVVSLRNLSGDAHTVVLDMIANGTPMETADPTPKSVTPWLAMPLSTTADADALKRITVGVRRTAFSPGEYSEVLSITVPGMSRWLMPVHATAPSLKGLWIGTVNINLVSQPHNYQHNCDENGEFIAGYSLCTQTEGQLRCDVQGKNPGSGSNECIGTNGIPPLLNTDQEALVDAPLQFRFLLHRDASDQVRLLKSVIQMWKDGTDPVTDPGHYVLVTDDTLVPNFKGVNLRDGEVVGKRISTVAYDFDGDTHDMAWAPFPSVLTTVISMPGNSPANPFRHKYHPQHDGVDADYVTPNNESYAVSRDIRIGFSIQDETQSNAANYSQLGGSYSETITGLHKYPISIRGTFTMRHVSPVDTLNQ